MQNNIGYIWQPCALDYSTPFFSSLVSYSKRKTYRRDLSATHSRERLIYDHLIREWLTGSRQGQQ
jgi:hypothetical protein